MDKTKKYDVTCFVVLFVSAVALAMLSVASGVTAWHIYQRTAMMRLADDANTPEQKAEYLGKFIAQLEDEMLPEYGAFVFTTEQNRTENQIVVLHSLKKRCDDLAKVDPSSLGYATGMEQITGQEFEGALNKTNGVIADAMWVRAGWLLAYGPWLWIGWIAMLICMVLCATL